MGFIGENLNLPHLWTVKNKKLLDVIQYNPSTY